MKNYVSFLLVLLSITTQSQISGNRIYESNSTSHYGSSKNSFKNTISINDNLLTVSIKVLLNNKADFFTLVLGTNEEAETVSECNTILNKRINGFTHDLHNMNIKKEDIYVDFISQTKVYDYNIAATKANEYQKGYEIKKNIIISSRNLAEIERIITLASKYAIYDVIKVDYYNDDIMNIHSNLFEEAMKIAKHKKDLYIKTFKKKIIGTPNASEDFLIFFPQSQYKKYQAFESAEIETYYRNLSQNQNFIKKLARKNTTFFYDGIDTHDFDKVINMAKSEVGIQYALTLTVSYKIDTSL
ncbi:hypothetical protein SY27_16105 [Flavobacterium sp. 316]|uniref:SIMPL domain-containing protein n=1 Tax=Flavobacterium sp. 316 TaxID=1603293 RepID=UPI0005E09C26|nr:SIMPL domain-containing protein [Flavobacterium sp. 316]KIX20038.1 hypothetical protein SY27_16105 [Flavobacterium sp. 316]